MFHRHALHRVVFAVSILVASLSVAAFAQSPNTASIAVVVFDQQAKTIAGAAVSVVNTETGARREAISGLDGSATIAALSLTGSYTISVAKQGFTSQDVRNVRFTAGEIATVRVTLLVSSGESQVTVYGTTDSVRCAAVLAAGNYLGRGVTTYGDTGTASPSFGQLVAAGTQAIALPAFANVDPPRMVQLLVRFQF